MNLFEKLKKCISIPPLQKSSGHFVVDSEIGISLLSSHYLYKNSGKLLLVTSNLYKAQRLFNLISSLSPKKRIILFPSDELIRAETLAQSKEMTAQRIFALSQIIHGNVDIIITNLTGSVRYLPKIEVFKNKCLSIKVGDSYDISSIRRKLFLMGYERVSKIDQSLQFASRGDILDVFSVNSDNPIRIEFFGDEIESIRYFDIVSQSSISKVDIIEILPATDILLSEEEFKNSGEKVYSALEKEQNRLGILDFETLRDRIDDQVTSLSEGIMSERLYKYYSFLSDDLCSIFDYCKDYKKIIVDKNAIVEANNLLQEETSSYINELVEDNQIIRGLNLYPDFNRVINFNSSDVIYTSEFLDEKSCNIFNVKSVPFVSNKKGDSINIINHYLSEKFKVVLCLSSHEKISLISSELDAYKIEFEKTKNFDISDNFNVSICENDLPSGFVLEDINVVYLTSNELFNEKVRTSHLNNRFKEATILKSYEELNPGDFVVHEYQGIGQFISLESIEKDGVINDYLKIAYWNNEFLYVPLSQFQLVRKYQGREGAAPRLSHLHSSDWENTKKKVKARINDLAERLMKLYIERNNVKGYAFQKDDEFQKDFESKFEFELTKDQLKAVREIKEDMEKDSPMDRLLCGDVGFGKTEDAFRAAFKAILSGKQVAILCPTILLARQHYELAVKRFSGFDINIAIFSRLIPDNYQKKYLKGVEDGSIHLIIGTHKILSKNMQFKDLGLLIIDEEQRFGVEQKERIKELKKNIDVLTLSATPIPRTLQISLLGVKPMSRIDTPPQERMPIQTYVTPFKLDIAKELIERELGRNGQVFFLHNNIPTLYLRANSLKKLIPSARIGVAHGQMEREIIEDVMMKFYNGEIDILVCTSIVENGIDVPNANMIIVEDSERYGLSQLYQIKGRVGRSNRIAYAYLMYSPYKQLTDKAKKRLKALQDFTQLGSGYRIAQRDLLIRGAGDILGPEQAGFIDSIGLDMYIKLLNETVKEKTEGILPKEITFNPNLSIKAYIPSNFANDQEKIELYQEIISSSSRESLARIKNKVRDMYGKLPDEVEQLFIKRNIDILCDDARVEKLEENNSFVDFTLSKIYINIRGIGNMIFEAMIPYLKNIKISYSNNVFKIRINKRNNWVADIENILMALANILRQNKVIEIL